MYSIPVFHPLVVHFPVALIPIGAAAAAGWLITQRREWHFAALFTLVPAALGAVASLLTGEAMEEYGEGMPLVDALVERHERLGQLCTFLTIVAAAVAFAARARVATDGAPPAPRGARPYAIACTIAAALAFALAVATGHSGGVMAWSEDVPAAAADSP